MTETRVLIEHQNARTAARLSAAFTEAGYSVETCPGPTLIPEGGCPLLVREDCQALDDADVILNALPLGDIRVFIAQRARARETPVLLALSDGERARVPVLDYLATVVPRDMDPAELIELVDTLVP